MKNIIAILRTSFYSCIGLILSSASVMAQTTILPKADEGGACIQDGSCGLSDIPFFIYTFANYLVGIAGTISVIMVMVGGYQTIMEGGSEAAKGKGKKTLIYAIAGLIITLLSWVIVNIIQVNLASPPAP